MPLSNVFRQPFLNPFQSRNKVRRDPATVHDTRRTIFNPANHFSDAESDYVRGAAPLFLTLSSSKTAPQRSSEQHMQVLDSERGRAHKGTLPSLGPKARWRLASKTVKRRLTSLAKQSGTRKPLKNKENIPPISFVPVKLPSPEEVPVSPSPVSSTSPSSSSQGSSVPPDILWTSSLQPRKERRRLHPRFLNFDDTTSEVGPHNEKPSQMQSLTMTIPSPKGMRSRAHADALLSPVPMPSLLSTRSSSSSVLFSSPHESNSSSSVSCPSENRVPQAEARGTPHRHDHPTPGIEREEEEGEEASALPSVAVVVTPSPPKSTPSFSLASSTSFDNLSHTLPAKQDHSSPFLTVPSASNTNSINYHSLQEELATTWDILLNSKLYYDERWDRASIQSVDSEMLRATVEPNLPHYPERNEYWREHCRIRERKARQLQLQQKHRQPSVRVHQPQCDGEQPEFNTMPAEPQTGDAVQSSHTSPVAKLLPEKAITPVTSTVAPGEVIKAIPLTEAGSLHVSEDVTEHAIGARALLEQQSQLAYQCVPWFRRAMTPQQTRARLSSIGHARYKTYSAYITAMQEDKNQCFIAPNYTDQKDLALAKRAVAPALMESSLLDSLKALQERSLEQQAVKRTGYVIALASQFEGPIQTDLSKNGSRHLDAKSVDPASLAVSPAPKDKAQKKRPNNLSLSTVNIHHTLVKYQPSRYGISEDDNDSEDDPVTPVNTFCRSDDKYPRKGHEQGILFVSSRSATIELSHSPSEVDFETNNPIRKVDVDRSYSSTDTVADMAAYCFSRSVVRDISTLDAHKELRRTGNTDGHDDNSTFNANHGNNWSTSNASTPATVHDTLYNLDNTVLSQHAQSSKSPHNKNKAKNNIKAATSRLSACVGELMLLKFVDGHVHYYQNGNRVCPPQPMKNLVGSEGALEGQSPQEDDVITDKTHSLSAGSCDALSSISYQVASISEAQPSSSDKDHASQRLPKHAGIEGNPASNSRRHNYLESQHSVMPPHTSQDSVISHSLPAEGPPSFAEGMNTTNIEGHAKADTNGESVLTDAIGHFPGSKACASLSYASFPTLVPSSVSLSMTCLSSAPVPSASGGSWKSRFQSSESSSSSAFASISSINKILASNGTIRRPRSTTTLLQRRLSQYMATTYLLSHHHLENNLYTQYQNQPAASQPLPSPDSYTVEPNLQRRRSTQLINYLPESSPTPVSPQEHPSSVLSQTATESLLPCLFSQWKQKLISGDMAYKAQASTSISTMATLQSHDSYQWGTFFDSA